MEGDEAPSLTYYPAEKKRGRGAVIICPGGGYGGRAPHEGEAYALFLNSAGLDAFVLNYRVIPYEFPCQLLDARRAVRLIRSMAKELDLNPKKIAIMGSSAGGHLAAMTSSYREALPDEGVDSIDRLDPIPNGQILCYPVTERDYEKDSYANLLGERLEELYETVVPKLIADENTPPAFMWHTAEDSLIHVANTYKYAARLTELGVPVELHVYPFGYHGLGLGNSEEYSHMRSWAKLLIKWLELFDFITEEV